MFRHTQAVNPLLRRAAGRLPSSLRRAGAGLLLDLRSLPARVRDPDRRSEPWSVVHNVGAGDFREAGEAILKALRAAGLRPDHRVLDIGCGAGRAAQPLAAALGPAGGYIGFDLSRRAVEGCRRRLAEVRPDFRFVHADVRNGDYNPRGRIEETEYRFPAEDGSIDLAFATSVYSHMRLPSIRRYLAETARVLAPGGRTVFTAYLLTDARRAAQAEAAAGLELRGWEGGAMVMDLRSPERAIAHDETAIREALALAGLTLRGIRWGSWSPPYTSNDWQDWVAAEKPFRCP